MEARYTKNAGAVFSLKYHLIWCSKYRRPVLTTPIDDRLKELILEKGGEMEAGIHQMEVMPDHVHLFIETDPRWSPAEVAYRLKGYTSRILRREFSCLRSRLPTLWSRSYFIASVGAVSEEAVQRYIAQQKGK